MRPIDADALLQRAIPLGWSTPKWVSDIVIDDAPTIDAVPVVRCKDCKHWGIHKSLNVPWCFEMHIDKSEDGYCDSGDRREDDTAN